MNSAKLIKLKLIRSITTYRRDDWLHHECPTWFSVWKRILWLTRSGLITSQLTTYNRSTFQSLPVMVNSSPNCMHLLTVSIMSFVDWLLYSLWFILFLKYSKNDFMPREYRKIGKQSVPEWSELLDSLSSLSGAHRLTMKPDPCFQQIIIILWKNYF